MLADSGLDLASLKPAESTWVPPVPFDQRFGWQAFYPEDPKTGIQISAASYRGKPVYFHVIGPWSRPWRMQTQSRTRARVVRDTTFVSGGFVFLLVSALFARRNLRLGRGDRRGAIRISAFLFFAAATSSLLLAHHVLDLGAEWQIFISAVGQALFLSSFLWLLYLALEPFVRRQWPELLISWSRLLSGKFRDPLIGCDVLVGILAGSFIGVGIHVSNALPAWFNVPGQTTIPPNPAALGSVADTLGVLVGSLAAATFPAFSITFALLLARTLLRNYWLSVVATGTLMFLINLGGENFALEAPFVLFITLVMMFVLLRQGMFALAVTLFTMMLLNSFPITVDLSKWYAAQSLFMFAVLLALLVYGLRVATGNKPLLAE